MVGGSPASGSAASSSGAGGRGHPCLPDPTCRAGSSRGRRSPPILPRARRGPAPQAPLEGRDVLEAARRLRVAESDWSSSEGLGAVVDRVGRSASQIRVHHASTAVAPRPSSSPRLSRSSFRAWCAAGHRALGAAEDLGHDPVREALEAHEDDRGLEILRQRVESRGEARVEAPSSAPRPDSPSSSRPRGRPRRADRSRPRAGTSCAASVVDGQVDGDAVDPGRELAPPVEPIDGLEGPEEGILGQVVGLPVVARHLQGSGVHLLLVPLDELAKRQPVPCCAFPTSVLSSLVCWPPRAGPMKTAVSPGSQHTLAARRGGRQCIAWPLLLDNAQGESLAMGLLAGPIPRLPSLPSLASIQRRRLAAVEFARARVKGRACEERGRWWGPASSSVRARTSVCAPAPRRPRCAAVADNGPRPRHGVETACGIW